IGLKVLDIPLFPGVAMVSGSAGDHPVLGIEASANPPYPLSGDLAINRVWLARTPQQAEFVDQAVDFETGELTSRFTFRADGVPNELHHDPDHEAGRLVARAAATGFDALRRASRDAWAELWRGRILIEADDDRWQRFADAAFFYLNASVHPSAPSSTSIFGLA